MGLAEYLAKRKAVNEAELEAVRNGTYEPRTSQAEGVISQIALTPDASDYSWAYKARLVLQDTLHEYISWNTDKAIEWQDLGLKKGDRVKIIYVAHNRVALDIQRI